jgi:hypothetical protein
MKLFRITLCGALLAVASAAMGQTRPGDVIVDVPFAFNVGAQTLPAGHYIVAPMDGAIRIFNFQTNGVYVPTNSATRTASDGSKLVFHRYGDTYFLSAVWVAGNTTGRQLFRSHAERDLATHKAEMELAVVRPEKVRPENVRPEKARSEAVRSDTLPPAK